MDTIGKLEEIFRHFPGIGPRQAKRFVYFLLTKSNGDLAEFSKLLTELKQNISVCQKCQRFFPVGIKLPTALCSICSDQNRDQESLMIVSRDIDLQAVEKSRAYHGVYFVLGGTIPIFEENPENKIRQKELLARVNELIAKEVDNSDNKADINFGLDDSSNTSNTNDAKSSLKEIIIATSVNPEGDNTASYLISILRDLASKHGFKISTLGRGLSTGTELEYSDSETLKSALENRH